MWSHRVKYQTFTIVFYSLGFFFFYISLWFWKPYFTELPAFCWQYCIRAKKPRQYLLELFSGESPYYIRALCLLILESDPKDLSCSLSVFACFMFPLLTEPKCAPFPTLYFPRDSHVRLLLHLQPLTPATQLCPAVHLYFPSVWALLCDLTGLELQQEENMLNTL